jgi:hypothetical protein
VNKWQKGRLFEPAFFIPESRLPQPFSSQAAKDPSLYISTYLLSRIYRTRTGYFTKKPTKAAINLPEAS